jgi:hypothetical protein
MSDLENYKNSALYRLLGEALPPIARIEQELSGVAPALVGEMIRREPDTVFLLDYYFRLLPRGVGGRIVSAPEFPLEAALELFNCQLIRYYRAHLHGAEHSLSYASILESYWRDVGSDRLGQLFRALLKSGTTMHDAAVLILKDMDLNHLLSLQQDPQFSSPAMLALFKELGAGVERLLHENLDLFDFAYRLASDLKDEAYMSFLDEFTLFIVQLRVARTLADDVGKKLGPDGRAPLPLLVKMLEDIPGNSQRLSLELLRQRGQVDAALVDSLLRMQAESGAFE